jgi:hypothetical protein
MEEGLVRGEGTKPWRFAWRAETFVQRIVPLPDRKRILALGNPKQLGRPTLSRSDDGGATWRDVTDRLTAALAAADPGVPPEGFRVRDLQLAPDGRIYAIVIVDPEGGFLGAGRGFLARVDLD